MAAAALTVAFILPSTAWAQVTAQIGSLGQLGPEGATVTVPLIVNCDPGAFVSGVAVMVVQSTGSRPTQGSGPTTVPDPTVCTGSDQTLSVTVGIQLPIFPFKQGKASASGVVSVFSPDPGNLTVNLGPQEIRIRK